MHWQCPAQLGKKDSYELHSSNRDRKALTLFDRTDGTTDLKANRRQSKSDRPEWHIAVVLVIGTSLIGIGSIPIGGMVEVEVVGRVRENDSRATWWLELSADRAAIYSTIGESRSDRYLKLKR
ncbi:hypothetical protein B296_00015315 [Ensete ventricosum]|uniref:Uncharacterized protein n=1 Tax=Ensete ventricosum TaxID=4639 RepID=A0A426Y1N1_ENSVE|nr:hypothetical protein B296_00015315 [Ensete ventricosum]